MLTKFPLVLAVPLGLGMLMLGGLMLKVISRARPEDIGTIVGTTWIAALWPLLLILSLVAALFMRWLPSERARPWRPGFWLVAPLSSLAAVFGGLMFGSLSFSAIMFGPWDGPEMATGPWLTMLPALAFGPALGFAFALAVWIFGGSLLRRV